MVRKAEPHRDGAACAAIYAPYVSDGVASFEADPPGPEEMAGRIARTWETHPWLVAERDGEVVGHVAITQRRTNDEPREPVPREGNLWRLFVVPDLWGSGLAADLLGRAHDELRGRGYRGCRLFTPKAHARARRFYEREGWHATGHEEYSESLELDLVEYRLELDHAS